MAASSPDAEAVATLVAAVGVTPTRARELLEAVGGSIERAADLHFSQAADTEPAASPPKAVPASSPPLGASQSSADTQPPEAKRRRGAKSARPGTGTPSRTLTAFFGRGTAADGGTLEEADDEPAPAAAASAAVIDFGGDQHVSRSPGRAVSSTAPPPLHKAEDQTAGGGAEFFIQKSTLASEKAVPSQSMPYSHLSAAFARLCATTKRKEKDSILLEAFAAILKQAPEDLVPAVYLSSNTLGPPWEDLDLGVGGSAIASAMTAATGATSRELSALWKAHGDAGDVAAALRARQRLLLKPETLTVRRVYEALLSVCGMTGDGCTSRRVGAMAGLIRAAQDSDETRFLVRTFACHIRTQATLTTVKDAAVAAIMQHRAVRDMACGDPPVQEVQRLARECFTACPDVRRVLEPLLRGGVPAMRKACAFSVGIPMRPMLARAETSVQGVLRAVGSGAIACEHKYDGQRAQIHRDAACRVRLFSRHLEDMTSKFPDLVGALGSACRRADGTLRPFVLDAEVVAVAPPGESAGAAGGGQGGEPGAPAAIRSDAFQRLSTRKRKDVTVGSIEVKVKVFAFDLLFLDAENLIGRPFRERRRLLHESFAPSDAFEFATYVDVDADGAGAGPLPAEPGPDREGAEEEEGPRGEAVQRALERSLAESCEGLMCKMLDAPYEPSDGSKRSPAWLKLKADYIEGMGDSLDLVPIGGWHGMGRKAKWISPFLLACWDPETESLQSVCRVMTGFTDAFYKEKTAFYLGHEGTEGGEPAAAAPEAAAPEAAAEEAGEEEEEEERRREGPDPRVVTGESPPLWFEPCEVWEVRGAMLSLSPKHKAAIGLLHPERGLSVRFPRFIRTRPDKALHEATSSAQLAEFFRNQQAPGGASASAPGHGCASASEGESEGR